MFEEIRCFQALYTYQDIDAAAASRGLKRREFCQMIAHLEQVLEISLIGVFQGELKITPAGEYLVQKSTPLMDQFEAVLKKARTITTNQKEVLRVGYIKNIYASQILEAAENFSREYPQIEIETFSGDYEDVYDALRHNQIDIAVNERGHILSDQYSFQHLSSPTIRVEVCKSNTLSQKAALDMKDLKKENCIILCSQKNQKLEEAYLSKHWGVMLTTIPVLSRARARELTALNKGVFVTVEEKVPENNQDVILSLPLLLNGQPVQQEYCLCWKNANESRHNQVFGTLLKKTF